MVLKDIEIAERVSGELNRKGVQSHVNMRNSRRRIALLIHNKNRNFSVITPWTMACKRTQTLVNGDNVVTVGWNGHARSIVGYDAITGDYDIRNPYDENHSSLTHAQLINRGAFVSWSNS